MTQQARQTAAWLKGAIISDHSHCSTSTREMVADIANSIDLWIEKDMEKEKKARQEAKNLCIFCKQTTSELDDYQIVLSRDALTSYIACVHPPCLEPFLAHQKVEESNHD